MGSGASAALPLSMAEVPDDQVQATINQLTPEIRARLKNALQVHDLENARARKRSKDAKTLAGKGFTVRQLLQFYDFYVKQGSIRSTTTTNDVVRNIIIPETSDNPRCYMESEFMKNIGGAKEAKRLVSHAWKSKFVNTVVNILLDACDRPRRDFLTLTEWAAGERKTVYNKGKLHADFLLKVLENYPSAPLDKTYWLCIFAVDEHRAICGVCWGKGGEHDPKCNTDSRWLADPVRHLQAGHCLICQQAKYNPCPCGTVKPSKGESGYEIDLFDEVVALMDALVVSLDGDLNSIQRVWVVAEIGKAMRFGVVFFRLCEDLSKETIRKLREGANLMQSVESCAATSPEDKALILEDIRSLEGGVQAYDHFINSMLEMSFGLFNRLPLLEGHALQAMRKLQSLQIDLTWDRDRLEEIHAWDFAFPHLRNFAIDCSHCKRLRIVSGIMTPLQQSQALRSAAFNFVGCEGLTNIDDFGKGLGQCQALQSASFLFRECSSLTSIDDFAKGLGGCQTLHSATFNFRKCEGLTNIDGFGKGLGQCQALQSATFNFSCCSGLIGIDAFGKGLAQCRSLKSATFYFVECSGLTSIDDFGKFVGQCQALQSATFNFGRCSGLTSIDGFGEGLRQCQALQSATFNFVGCSSLTNIDDFGKFLGQCQALQSATFDFSCCSGLTSIDNFRKIIQPGWTLW